MKKETIGKIMTVGAATTAAAAVTYMTTKKIRQQQEDDVENAAENRDYGDQQVYFTGGGIGSMAGAAYLIRDCNFKGSNIHILEGMDILGGSNDGIGTPEKGFVCRGGRMLNEETYENFWDLFRSIPSLDHPDRDVTTEILNFDHAHPTHARARLVDKDGIIQDVFSMGFDNNDRMTMGKLLMTPEKELNYLTIEEWFKDTPHFFTTNFWYMWQTTFAFQKWSSLFEFKRYMERMILEFSRIETLEGVTRTPYNQYDSVILPLKAYLKTHNVQFEINNTVTDIDFADNNKITATDIHITKDNEESIIHLNEKDICIVTNGCMTDSATLGNFKEPAPAPEKPAMSAALWKKLSAKKPGLGNPEPFFGKPHETNWESFTITCKGNRFLKMIEDFSGNIPGSGALMTFKDSSWLMSIVIAAQPHFINQPLDTTIFWGYGLYTDHIGDYIKKPMKDCTGEEMLQELIYQLHFEDHMDELMDSVVNVIPCMMPYIDAQFEPRAMSDRPAVVPEGSTNFAMISQFVEIPEDMVFTEEYSVRAARIAIYTLFDIKRPICPVTPWKHDPKVLIKALKTAYR
ncbi:MAG: oleate hydratase [Eubacterium sp.]